MKTVTIDCAGIRDKASFHDTMESALAFPSWYGKNLDALHDCLTEVFTNTRICFVNWHSLEETLGLYTVAIRRAMNHAAEENPCIEIVYED